MNVSTLRFHPISMSEPDHQETLPLGPEAAEPKPALKRAAKKTVAKKTAAKKTARKKAEPVTEAPAPESNVSPTPRKRAGKVATKSVELSAEASPNASQPAEESAALPEPAHADTPAESHQDVPRFGRVPGGGPTQQAPADPAPAQSQAGEQANFQNRESRSKRRREKRKRKNHQRFEGERPEGGRPDGRNDSPSQQEPRAPQFSGPKIETNGMLEMAPKGFGFLRVPSKRFEQARDDVFVSPDLIRRHNLRVGHWIHGLYQEGNRGPQLVEITSINDLPPEQAARLPHFDELKAINPGKRISFETDSNRYTTRVVDIMAPVGRGQRGLIVSPPRSGKTTLLLHMAEAVREKYEDSLHLMVLLVDERPEEVTEFRRALPGAEIYASSNDEQPRNHCRIAELAIERAKRLVEAGKDVFLLMDSITRLARAYNGSMNNRGRGTGSGGITIGALEVPRRLFAAARNTREAGSLTILATALIQTNSRADEAIFMEFKGTGNMELVLDRKIAENYLYPAADIFKSGTRREELLLPEHMLHKIHLIRRGLSGHRPAEAMERLLFFLKKFPNNPQMLLEIKG
jgi:transcription termination factor Rho